jgi:hypothetical protein
MRGKRSYVSTNSPGDWDATLATFTDVQRGADEALRLLRAMLRGFLAFALFCFTLSIALRTLGVGVAFLLAVSTALTTQLAILLRTGRRRRTVEHPVGEVAVLSAAVAGDTPEV